MVRKKIKYKDVIGKVKIEDRKKRKPSYSQNSYKNGRQKKQKRKFTTNLAEELENKKQKVEQDCSQNKISETSESETEIDDMRKLLNTFSEKRKNKSVAIDSTDSESENGIEDIDIDKEKEVENKSLNKEELCKSSDDSIIETLTVLNDRNKSKEKYHGEVEYLDKTGNQSETEQEVQLEKEYGDVDNSHDPFAKHLFYELGDSVLHSLQSNPVSFKSDTQHWPKLGRLIFQIPKCEEINENINSNNIIEKKICAPCGRLPKKLYLHNTKLDSFFLKSQIINNIYKNSDENSKDILNILQAEIFSIINNYQDLYYPERTLNNAEEIRYVYCLHVANHILKTRLKVIHHNTRLSNKNDVPEEFRDQGLVRPKVLIILPFKSCAYKTVQMLIDLILPHDKGNVINKKRFIDDYTGNELVLPKKNPKPEDYEQTFQGNTSDDFKIGITVTKKSLKLYADFYSSDIIIASPLGLRTIIGAEGEQERDYDFLASIELLILDQTEIFLMQNWDHIFHIFNHMHLQPKESHGTDFSRVRIWSLNGWAKYYRQTLIFSSVILPEINAIFNKKCLNYAGKVRVANKIECGCITQVFIQLPHVFHRFDAQNTADVIDARFDFFLNKILPQQKDSLMKQTLIFIPNYFDYVRLRNYFKKEDLGFVQICEYSKEGKVARARDMFYHGDAHFLLYTERYHFFNRKRIKGIRHLVFYQPPYFPHFYHEMCNLMQAANMNKKIGNASNMTVTVIYSKYDIHQLSSVVGTVRATKMIQSDRKVHMMVIGVD